MSLFFGQNKVATPAVSSNVKHGYLYNGYAILEATFAPTGWHIPTNTELGTLVLNSATSLCSTSSDLWLGPGTNTTGFTASGSGYRDLSDGSFQSLKLVNNLWSSTHIYDEATYISSYVASIDASTAAVSSQSLTLLSGFSVKLIADTYSDWGNGDIVTDLDGNIYTVIVIGTQAWLQQNWACSKLNDSTAIPNVTDAEDWSELSTPGRCAYNNTESNVFI